MWTDSLGSCEELAETNSWKVKVEGLEVYVCVHMCTTTDWGWWCLVRVEVLEGEGGQVVARWCRTSL